MVSLVLNLHSCCIDCGMPCTAVEPSIFEKNFYCFVYDSKTKETVVGLCVKCAYRNKASVLVNENGDTIKTEFTIDTDGAMKFPLVFKGRDSIGYDINQSYFLHLVDYQGIERDVDTIRFAFKLVNDDCRIMDYKDFKCYFNDSLYLTDFPMSKDFGRVFFYK